MAGFPFRNLLIISYKYFIRNVVLQKTRIACKFLLQQAQNTGSRINTS